jgi:hypothetical protein
MLVSIDIERDCLHVERPVRRRLHTVEDMPFEAAATRHTSFPLKLTQAVRFVNLIGA